MSDAVAGILRTIPPVGDIMESPEVRGMVDEFGIGVVKVEVRRCLDALRQDIRHGRCSSIPDKAALVRRVSTACVRLCLPEGRRAVNATGILLHTGLGRAPLCEAAIDVVTTGRGFSLLQTSIDSGTRSVREETAERLLREITGCAAATVVNNNAAATMLLLNTLAEGKEVIVSRGQLVEIGGSFRLPDVMARSSAILREVGTTNKTHLKDYEAAVGERTGAIIHVHTSNFRIRGFASSPGITELCALGKKRGIPVIDDLGSGALVRLSQFGVEDEPLVQDSIAAGADVVCFSGDKLIGGPQSGIICGTKDWLDRVRKNPFARMFRVCKMTLAALERTLALYLDDISWRTAVPFYRMLARKVEDLDCEAQAFAARLEASGCAGAVAARDWSYIGSGSAPDEGVPSAVVRVKPAHLSADEAAARLRQHVPAVFCRVQDGALQFDMRTLLHGDADVLASAVPGALRVTDGEC